MKIKTKNLVISVGALGLIAVFQNCSPVSFEQAAVQSSLGDHIDPGPGFVLVPKSQDVSVHANSAVDILFVVDNSGSMKEEQAGLSNKISGFMNIVKDLDWQVALTTTDARTGTSVPDENGVKRAWGGGNFRAFDSDNGSKFVLKASVDDPVNAQNMLANAIQVGIKGNGNETGILVTSKAMDLISSSGSHQEFFRSHAKLVVVLISDEDECSNGSCINSGSESNPDNLVAKVKSMFGDEKVFKFNSIIKAPGDSGCKSAATAGTYTYLSHLSGGVIGSICASDYTSILADMGQKVLDLVRSANLACEPADLNNDGKGDVSVKLSNGAVLSSGYKLQGKTITFDDTLPEGMHRISYSCLELKK